MKMSDKNSNNTDLETESLDIDNNNGPNKTDIISNGSNNFSNSILLSHEKSSEKIEDDSSSTENEEEVEMMTQREGDDIMQSNLKSRVETTTPSDSGDIRSSDDKERATDKKMSQKQDISDEKSLLCSSSLSKENDITSSEKSSCSSNTTPTCSSPSCESKNKKGRNDVNVHHHPPHDGISNDTTVNPNGLDSSQEEDLDDHCDDPDVSSIESKEKGRRQEEVENLRHSRREGEEEGDYDSFNDDVVVDVKGVTGDDGDEHQEQQQDNQEVEGRRIHEGKEEDNKEDDKDSESESNLQETRRRSLRRRLISGQEEEKNIKKQRSSSSTSCHSDSLASCIPSKEITTDPKKKTEASKREAKQTDNDGHGDEEDEGVFNDRKHRPSSNSKAGVEENDHHENDDEQQRQEDEDRRRVESTTGAAVNDERDLTMKRKRKRSHPDRHQENYEDEEDISHDVLVTEETVEGEADASSHLLTSSASSLSLDLSLTRRVPSGRLLRSTQHHQQQQLQGSSVGLTSSSLHRLEDNQEGKTGFQEHSPLHRPHHQMSIPSKTAGSSTTSQVIMKQQKDNEEDEDKTDEEEEMQEEDDDHQERHEVQRLSSDSERGIKSNTSTPAATLALNHLLQQQLPSPRKKFKDDTIADRDWICPVCNENQGDQHTFTVHIRQHNPTDHSHTCSICGKTLSSASSLDRHMLIHSGERPFKCRICQMAFTTNGNMHRHMRTHGMELNDDLTPMRGRGPRNLRDSSGHRRLSQASRARIEVDESSNHSEDSGHVKSTASVERSPGGVSDSSTAKRIRPEIDAVSAMKNLMNSKFPFSANPVSVPAGGLGFFDLSFTDFSSKKFPSIAQSFCEHNLRKSASPYHEYECVKCQRGFPSGSSLNLHESAVHSSTFCGFCHLDLGSPDNFIKHMFQHQLEGLRNGTESVSSFLANNPFAQSSLNDKEGFMAMLQLHNREQERLQALQMENKESKGSKNVSDSLNLTFDDPAYFVHAKPSPKSISVNSNINQRGDSEIDVGKASDLADIQSIISVTKSGNHLKQMSTVSPSDGSASEEESLDVAKFDSKREGSMSSNDGIGSNTEEERAMTAQEQESRKGSPNEAAVSNNNNNNNNDLSCKVCGVEFKNSSALKKHSRGHMHGGGHNYSCHLCSYTSLDKSTLVRHLRTHNGERPFQCVICKYAFTTKANCERHVRKRHKKFSKSEIKASMQFNTDLLASSSASIDSLNLNNSSLSLIGSRNRDKVDRHPEREDHDSAADSSDHFPNASDTICKYCKVDFKFNRVLKHHLRSLNNSCNRKPYICSVCTIGFSTKNNCLRHVLRQHPQTDGDKAISCILFNGTAMNATSYAGSEDLSDDESSQARIATPLNNTSTSLLKPPAVRSPSSSSSSRMLSQASLDDNKHHSDRNSSLAALCSVGASKPLNMSSKMEHDAYDGGDEFDENNNDEQPFDLSKTSAPLNQDRSRGHTPLDLTSQVLDLSCKQSPPAHKPKTDQFTFPSNDDVKVNDLSVRSAASTLLALQSMASGRFPLESKPAFPASSPSTGLPFLAGLPHSMAAAFAQNPLFYHQAMMSAQQGLHPSLIHPSAASAVVDNLLKLSAAAAANNGIGKRTTDNQVMHNSPLQSVSPSPASLSMLAKNERHFTCKYCQAGFTLKSNMERHIKRKHPSFARASRSVRSASCGSSGPKDESPHEGSPEVLPPQAASSSHGGKSCGIAISDETRAALRDVLIFKSNNGDNDRQTLDNDHDEDFDSSEEIDVEATGNDSIHMNNVETSSQALKHITDKNNTLRPETNYRPSENHSTNYKDERSDDEESDHQSSSSFGEDVSSSKESPKELKNSHRRSAYTDSPNSVICPYCSRKFPWSSSLRRHILTHTGAKPYKCPKCPILFTTKSNCERHLIRKHKTIAEVSEQEDSSSHTRDDLAPHLKLSHWSRQSSNSLISDIFKPLRKSPSGDSAESPPSDELTSPPPEDTDSGKSINSLLYATSDHGMGLRSSTSKESSSSSSDLIQNLLGITDPKMLDEMLGSVDSAARLLGIRNKVFKGAK